MSVQTVEKVMAERIEQGKNFITKFVDIGTGSGKLNNGVLQAEKASEYMQALQEATVFLDNTKLIPSHNHKRELDMMSFNVELEAGRISGTPQTLSDYQDPNFVTRAFSAEEYRALTGLHRTTLYDSIEQKRLMNTLTQHFGEANGRALERVLIYGNTESTDASASTGYKVNDGILKKLQDDSTITPGEIDLTDSSSNVLDEIRAVIDAFPDKYKDDGGLVMFVPRILTTTLRRYIADHKDISESIAYITEEGNIKIEDVELINVPAFSTPKNGYTQKPVILTHRENIQWLADPDNIIVESDFNLRSNKYDIASTMYADIQFAFTDASMVAFLKEA